MYQQNTKTHQSSGGFSTLLILLLTSLFLTGGFAYRQSQEIHNKKNKEMVENIKKNLDAGDYETANTLYSQIERQTSLFFNPSLKNALFYEKQQIEYYRSYRSAVDIFYSPNPDWELLTAKLNGMPDNFKLQMEVRKMLTVADTYFIDCYKNGVKILKTKCSQLIPTTQTYKTTTQNKTESIGEDAIVNCGPFPKSKQTLQIKKSECSRYTDCQLGDKWIPMEKNSCLERQTGTNRAFDFAIGNQKIRMTYMAACWNAMNAYWDAKNKGITFTAPTPAPSSSNSTSTSTSVSVINESACRTQYQIEVQAANSLSAGAREAAIQIATQSLNRCLSTGTVEKNTIQLPPTPTPFDNGYYGGVR